MKALRLLALAILNTLLSGCADSLIQATPAMPTPTPTEMAVAPKESVALYQVEPTGSPTAQAFLLTGEPPTPESTATAPAPTLIPSTPLPTPTDSVGQLVIPSPTVSSAEAPTATLAAQLQSTVLAEVPPTLTPDVTGMSPFAMRLSNTMGARYSRSAFTY